MKKSLLLYIFFIYTCNFSSKSIENNQHNTFKTQVPDPNFVGKIVYDSRGVSVGIYVSQGNDYVILKSITDSRYLFTIYKINVQKDGFAAFYPYALLYGESDTEVRAIGFDSSHPNPLDDGELLIQGFNEVPISYSLYVSEEEPEINEAAFYAFSYSSPLSFTNNFPNVLIPTNTNLMNIETYYHISYISQEDAGIPLDIRLPLICNGKIL